jgi:excisionase family DNA binding protein
VTGLLTLRDVADRLCLARGTVYALVHAGKLPAVKLGDGPKAHIRVRPEDLERYVSARAVVPTASPSPKTRAEECAARGIEPDHAFS